MYKSISKKRAGFTLIETMVYLALFGIIIGGITVTVYGIIESAGRSQTKIMAQEEAGFLLGKLDWALTGASDVAVSVTPPSLSVTRYTGPSPFVFDVFFSGGRTKLRLTEGAGGTAVDLNSDAVQVINPSFQYNDNPPISGKPKGIKISFTLRSRTPNGATLDQAFETIKYLR